MDGGWRRLGGGWEDLVMSRNSENCDCSTADIAHTDVFPSFYQEDFPRRQIHQFFKDGVKFAIWRGSQLESKNEDGFLREGGCIWWRITRILVDINTLYLFVVNLPISLKSSNSDNVIVERFLNNSSRKIGRISSSI